MHDIVDRKLFRVGHVALEVQGYNGHLLLVWGGYMVSKIKPSLVCHTLLLFSFLQQNPNQETFDQEYHDPSEILLYDPMVARW